jgi:NADPH-dependent 2,4-dienoyl-CoA reductase/sulfur reductase-like enzyme
MGKETKYPEELPKDGNGRKVAVIGAGPGGLEAAMILGKRGFQVILLEKEDHLGGQMYLSSLPPHKQKMHHFITYAEKQLKDAGVDVRLSTPATEELIQQLQPEAVILATGSTAVMPRSIKGIDGDNVYAPAEVLQGKVNLEGKKVCIIGSGLTGLETGEYLLERGCEVSIYEMQDKIAPTGFALVSMDETGALAREGVRTCPGHKLLELQSDCAVFEDNAGYVIKEPCDAAVISLGIRPVKDLEESLSKNYKVIAIGDANQLGRIPQAVAAGYEAAIGL